MFTSVAFTGSGLLESGVLLHPTPYIRSFQQPPTLASAAAISPTSTICRSWCCHAAKAREAQSSDRSASRNIVFTCS